MPIEVVPVAVDTEVSPGVRVIVHARVVRGKAGFSTRVIAPPIVDNLPGLADTAEAALARWPEAFPTAVAA